MDGSLSKVARVGTLSHIILSSVLFFGSRIKTIVRSKIFQNISEYQRVKVLFLLKIVSSLLFFSILQMVSHVFMADVGYSGQILSYADSAWSCVGNDMPCLLCC